MGTLFGRLYFGGNDAATRGYATLGLGGGQYEFTRTDEKLKASGPGMFIGGGLEHMFGNNFSLFGELRLGGVNIQRISIAGVSVSGFDYDAGVVNVLFGGRVRIR